MADPREVALVRLPNPLYESLPSGHLRLLQINGKIEGLLHCSLAVFSTDPTPTYVAISYTWGAPEDPEAVDSELGSGHFTGTRTIIVNGQPFEIRQNLFDLLEELEPEHEPTWYWIDVLCINQDDNEEKSQQVNRMGTVYEAARSVTIWLGRAHDSTPHVIGMIQQIAVVMGRVRAGDPAYQDLSNLNDPRDPDQNRRLGLEGGVTLDDWHAFALFLRRTWFSRVWTIQEAALARAVVCRCGPMKFSWAVIYEAAMVITLTGFATAIGSDLWWPVRHRPTNPFLLLMSYTRTAMLAFDTHAPSARMAKTRLFKVRYNVPSVYSSAAALLDYSLGGISEHQSEDSRDRVFAILGVVRKAAENGQQSLAIKADYGKSVVEVYTEAMVYIITELKTLTPLARVQHPLTQSIPGLPSWVNDLTVPKSTTLLELNSRWITDLECNNVGLYNASRASAVGFAVERHVLNFHFHRYATVTHIGDSWDEMAYGSSLEKTAQLALARLSSNAARGVLVDDIWKTMVCNVLVHLAGEFAEHEVRSAFGSTLVLMLRDVVSTFPEDTNESEIVGRMSWLGLLAGMDETGTIPSPTVALELGTASGPDLVALQMASMPFQTLARRAMGNRRLFLLDTGEIGLGGHDVQPGDTLCIIADGGRTPFLLRKAVTKSDNTWAFISEAYVRGIMYGEAVDKMEKDGKSWEKGRMI